MAADTVQEGSAKCVQNCALIIARCSLPSVLAFLCRALCKSSVPRAKVGSVRFVRCRCSLPFVLAFRRCFRPCSLSRKRPPSAKSPPPILLAWSAPEGGLLAVAIQSKFTFSPLPKSCGFTFSMGSAWAKWVRSWVQWVRSWVRVFLARFEHSVLVPIQSVEVDFEPV